MNDKRKPETDASKARRAAEEQREAERERAASRPFEYPHPERRAGVRARRRISEQEADADTQPGIPGGYGTTGGGQPGGTGAAHPPTPRRRRGDESGDTPEPTEP
ncbi:hypothetical protein [Streptomyces sp. NPDC047079]|uniref:hypothetical protein n=1 Tax=Streptomyces sp. NPDC047079 TaxID=3154607 RepID=UPI0033E77390